MDEELEEREKRRNKRETKFNNPAVVCVLSIHFLPPKNLTNHSFFLPKAKPK